MGMTAEIRLDLTAAVLARMDRTATQIAEAVAADVAERARQKILTGPKSGRIYEHGPQPLPHQASAPGESPANWTGQLADSITSEVTGPGAAVARVADPKGALLELGTVKMGARPFFVPAAEEAQAEIEVVIGGLVEGLEGA